MGHARLRLTEFAMTLSVGWGACCIFAPCCFALFVVLVLLQVGLHDLLDLERLSETFFGTFLPLLLVVELFYPLH